MPHFNFVVWLMRKAYRSLSRFDPLYGSTAAKYNRLEESLPYGAALGRLGMLVIALIFFGLPMAGYVYLVAALPLSPTAQWLVLMGSGLVVLLLVGRHLLKHAQKRF